MISWMNFSVELLEEILRRADISSAGKDERGLSFECEYLNTEPPRSRMNGNSRKDEGKQLQIASCVTSSIKSFISGEINFL